jgi:hypothetical protein
VAILVLPLLLYFFSSLSSLKIQKNLIHVTIGNNNHSKVAILYWLIFSIILFQFFLNALSGNYTNKKCQVNTAESNSFLNLRLFTGTKGDGSLQFYFFQFVSILIDQVGVIYQGVSQINITQNIINFVDGDNLNNKMNHEYGYETGTLYASICNFL